MRKRRAEQPLADPDELDRLAGTATAPAEEAALLADSVSNALLVVLDRLSPAQRVAFVLHDVFAMPFEKIAGVLDRSPAAANDRTSNPMRILFDMFAPVILTMPDLKTVVADATRAAERTAPKP